MRPLATSPTAATATRPSQRTLAPTPSSSPWPPPTATTSQPSASSTGIDSAAARRPLGSVTSAWTAQPRLGPPSASRRSARSAFVWATMSGPPAHTTIEPFAHDAWSRISPVGSAVGMRTSDPLLVEPMSRS